MRLDQRLKTCFPWHKHMQSIPPVVAPMDVHSMQMKPQLPLAARPGVRPCSLSHPQLSRRSQSQFGIDYRARNSLSSVTNRLQATSVSDPTFCLDKSQAWETALQM